MKAPFSIAAGSLGSKGLRQRCAFTLLELIVALALSVLILRLVLPLMARLTRASSSTAVVDAIAIESWRLALQADLDEHVAQIKSPLPVIQVFPAGPDNAFARLEIQTFCRAGHQSRGPMSAIYRLEPEGPENRLALVRYGAGWQDNVRTRHVLLRDLAGWEIHIDAYGSARQSAIPTTQTSDPKHMIRVVIHARDGERRGTFWINGSTTVQ